MARIALTTLNEHECWALLTAHRPRLGRIGFAADDRVVIHPMNFAVSQRTIFLRTDPDSRIAEGDRSVAFEVDHVDQNWERGWSVLVQGHLTPVTDPAELERNRELVLRTWAPGNRLHLMRLEPTSITGRRIR